MKQEKFEIGGKYKSRINNLATDCRYEVIKKNKTTCHVRLWDSGVRTETIYKNVRYGYLTE